MSSGPRTSSEVLQLLARGARPKAQRCGACFPAHAARLNSVSSLVAANTQGRARPAQTTGTRVCFLELLSRPGLPNAVFRVDNDLGSAAGASTSAAGDRGSPSSSAACCWSRSELPFPFLLASPLQPVPLSPFLFPPGRRETPILAADLGRQRRLQPGVPDDRLLELGWSGAGEVQCLQGNGFVAGGILCR